MSISLIVIISDLAPNGPPPLNPAAWQAMLSMVGIVCCMFWILTFRMNSTIFLLFGLLTATVFLLAAGVSFAHANYLAGWFGLVTSANAFWFAFAILVNDIVGKGAELIPLGAWHHRIFDGLGRMIHGPVAPQPATHYAIRDQDTMDLEGLSDSSN